MSVTDCRVLCRHDERGQHLVSLWIGVRRHRRHDERKGRPPQLRHDRQTADIVVFLLGLPVLLVRGVNWTMRRSERSKVIILVHVLKIEAGRPLQAPCNMPFRKPQSVPFFLNVYLLSVFVVGRVTPWCAWRSAAVGARGPTPRVSCTVSQSPEPRCGGGRCSSVLLLLPVEWHGR